MSWKLDKSRPICPQIEEIICVKIANGEYQADCKLASVREVAVAAGINPNTVQKAFESLEREQLIYSVRGSGWYIGSSKQKAAKLVQKLVQQSTIDYFEKMKVFGYDTQKVKDYIKEWNL